jgi:hypothetical protein
MILMPVSGLKFNEINVNCLNVVPISEFFLEPKAIAKPFSFFSDFDKYFELYERSFLDLYRVRKEKADPKTVRFRFVKGLGALRPLSGHEVKTFPIFRGMGGKMKFISTHSRTMSAILPMKILPNWKIDVNQQALKPLDDFKKARCSSLIKIYPLGIVSYQTRFYFTFEHGINLSDLIFLLEQIDRKKLLITNKGGFNAKSLIHKFHELILKDFVIGKPMVSDMTFSQTHRILTIKKVEGDLSVDVNKNELVGLSELEPRWESLAAKHVEDRLGKRKTGDYDGVLSGKYVGQFFTILPSCTIIYPINPWKYEHEKAKFDTIVKKIIRTNFTSIIEAATIQSHFAKTLDNYLMKAIKEPKYTQTRKKQLLSQLDRIEQIEWLLDSSYLKKWLKGGHESFFNKVEKRIGLKRRLRESLKKRDKLKDRMKEDTMGKTVVLFLASNPLDSGRLLLGKEVNAIEKQLRLAKLDDKFEIEDEFDVEINQIMDHLYHYKPNIVHFSGHGSDKGEILLLDKKGLSNPVPVDALSKLFSIGPIKSKIRLVVLNACFTRPQAEAISKHIDCVIGMSSTIKDDVAIIFAKEFYRNLAEGCNIREAFTGACAIIEASNMKQSDVPNIIWKDGKEQKICFVDI